jgi:hypothetical protein
MMKSTNNSKMRLAFLVAALMLFAAAGQASAQGKSAGKGGSKKDEKQLNKESRKLGDKADEAADQLGRDVVFCILAAHTSGVGTAQQLKDSFTALTDFPFGQFVAAVLLADRLDSEDLTLDTILAKMKDGMSIGQITKEAGVNMGEVRRGFGQFRSELARSMTNPPTRDCFKSNP